MKALVVIAGTVADKMFYGLLTPATVACRCSTFQGCLSLSGTAAYSCFLLSLNKRWCDILTCHIFAFSEGRNPLHCRKYTHKH